ncbi:class F sortase [Kitasatospora sp. NPDC059795]|uniref:class F sortase n=1 Tax=Kitasatospora sp. NPDC059795 TaxID=3346949 RepID=UPI0036683495
MTAERHDDAPGSGRSRRAGRLLPLLIAASLAGAALLGRSALGPHPGRAAPAGVDMNGRPVQLDPGGGLAPQQRQQQDAKPEGAGRFVVPSVGLDVPLGTMNEVAGSVVPPGFASAFLIVNLGAPTSPATGTVYVAMHSLRWGAVGPGNYLFAPETGTSKVAPGAAVFAGGVRYVVDGATAVPKAELPDADAIWADVPGRLVVLTCLERPDNSPAVDNFVIVAHLDPSGADPR